MTLARPQTTVRKVPSLWQPAALPLVRRGVKPAYASQYFALCAGDAGVCHRGGGFLFFESWAGLAVLGFNPGTSRRAFLLAWHTASAL